MAASIVADEIRKAIDLADLVTLPMDAAEQFTGLGAKQISRRFPVRTLSERKKGVSLRAVQNFLADITSQPDVSAKSHG